MILTEPPRSPLHRQRPPSKSDGLPLLPAPPRGVPERLWRVALTDPATEFLARPGKQFRARLVQLAWQAADGRGSPPPALLALPELLHAGSLIVDDIQDDSLQRRGRAALHRLVGLPVALNTGNWLYFWPVSLLANLGLPADTELALTRLVLETLRLGHEGQALDLATRIGDVHPNELPGLVATISDHKTGALMGLAAAAGAMAAGADATTANALATFGRRLGVALQMQNDLSELNGAAGPLKHPEDLIHGRVTWPWAWAAQRLCAAEFDPLQLRGAKLADGHGDPAALAADLLAALGPDPAAPVRHALTEALDTLRSSSINPAALREIHAEVHRLETQYV